MKITLIEGENLASFADGSRALRLDLESEPLRSANLFAIIGKTGAGKSTILDAVCLALYGELPRVRGAKDGDAIEPEAGGTAGYAPGAPISVVRRGASRARASCEFLGTDGNRYKSEWSVRTVQSRAGPPRLEVQPPRLSVADGTGGWQTRTDKSREHVQRVEVAIGMDAAEFRRAALLAQNDFANFLHANADERSQILESLTGAERYSAIGRRLFERRKQEQECVAAATRDIQSSPDWTNAERAEAEAEAQAASVSLSEIDVRVAQLGEEARAVDELARLRAADEDLAAKAAVAVATANGRTADRARLAAADAAEPLRGALFALDQAAARRSEAERQRQQRSVAADEAATNRTASRACAERLQAAEVLARAAFEAERPALANAREADAMRIAAEAELDAATQAATDELAPRDARRAEVREIEEERDRYGAVAATHRKWLEANAAIGIALGRGDPTSQLETLVRLGTQAETRKRELALRSAAARAAETVSADADTVAVEAAAAVAAARSVRAAFGAAPDLHGLYALRDQAAARRDRSSALRDAERSRDDRTLVHETAQLALSRAARAEEVRCAEASAARAEAAARAVAVEEERAGVRWLQKRTDLSAHRRDLEPGKPCPLCGATDHPSPNDESPSDLRRAEAGLAQLEGELRAATAVANEALLDCAAAQAEQERAGADVAAAAAARDEAESTVRDAEARRAHDGPMRPQADEDGEVAALADVAEAARVSVGAIQEADAELQRAQEVQVTAAQAAGPLAAARASAVASEVHARAECRSLEAEHALALAAAQDAVAGWPGLPELAMNADAARAKVQADAAAHAAAASALAAAEGGVAETAGRAHLAAASRARAEEAHRRAVASQLACEETLRGAIATRAALLDGRPAELVEEGHHLAIEGAMNAAREAEAAAHAAEAVAEAAAREQAIADEAAADAGRGVEAASAALGAALAVAPEREGHRQTEAGARADLMEAAEREALRASLAGLELAVAQALALAAGARADRDAFAPTRCEPDTFPTRRQAAKEERASATERVQSARQAVHAGLERAHRHAVAKANLEQAQAALDPWNRLCEVVGDKEGKHFRLLAASRALQDLVDISNQQLRRFAPRYTLLPAGKLELHVLDGETGERRGTRSLSGGETFLVSLGLALALGRMSHRTRGDAEGTRAIKTLFIDEGFGALDAESIGPVIAALGHLAENGVQVGLISHVHEIAAHAGVRVEVRKRGQTSELLITNGRAGR